jgi:hypothetical protein
MSQRKPKPSLERCHSLRRWQQHSSRICEFRLTFGGQRWGERQKIDEDCVCDTGGEGGERGGAREKGGEGEREKERERERKREREREREGERERERERERESGRERAGVCASTVMCVCLRACGRVHTHAGLGVCIFTARCSVS